MPENTEPDQTPDETPATEARPKKEKAPVGKLPDGSYAFKVGKVRHVLPPMNESLMTSVPGSVIMDSYLSGDPDGGEMRTKFGLLEAARSAAPEAVEALRAMSFGDLNDHLNTWLGESSGSSD